MSNCTFQVITNVMASMCRLCAIPKVDSQASVSVAAPGGTNDIAAFRSEDLTAAK